MKLGKIGALCKNAKRFVVYNVASVQWISDGAALYPLRELPPLEEENIYTIFDIPEDKRGKIAFEARDNHPYGISFDDAVKGESVMQFMPITFFYHGTLLSPMKCESGILFIDRRYLAPFDDGIALYERFYPGGDRPYVAVKRGMLLEGIITPAEIATVELAEMLTQIGKLTAAIAGDDDSEEYEQEILDI